MSQRAYCEQPHSGGDAEADRYCEEYHCPQLLRLYGCACGERFDTPRGLELHCEQHQGSPS